MQNCYKHSKMGTLLVIDIPVCSRPGTVMCDLEDLATKKRHSGLNKSHHAKDKTFSDEQTTVQIFKWTKTSARYESLLSTRHHALRLPTIKAKPTKSAVPVLDVCGCQAEEGTDLPQKECVRLS